MKGVLFHIQFSIANIPLTAAHWRWMPEDFHIVSRYVQVLIRLGYGLRHKELTAYIPSVRKSIHQGFTGMCMAEEIGWLIQMTAIW